MKSFILEKKKIKNLQIIKRQPVGDTRGYFERLFCTDELKALIGKCSIVQINRTLTKKTGTIRGLHFQHPPYAEMKFVSCLRGKVFDVAIDLRKDSPTFLQWQAEILSENNHQTFCIPEGFAHGFQTLTEDCELIYLHTAPYVQDAKSGLNALDPRLAIAWPLPIAERSERDKYHAMLTSDFLGLST